VFEQALRADPENQKARFALAQLETADGKFSVSLRVAGPVLAELHHSGRWYLLLAKDYAGLNQIEYLLALVPDWKACPGSQPGFRRTCINTFKPWFESASTRSS